MVVSEEQRKEFQDWMRSRIRLVGEELIRRSEKLDLGGLDLITDVDISVHIPTIGEEICWPSLSICFNCGEKKYLDNLISGEVLPPPNQEESHEG